MPNGHSEHDCDDRDLERTEHDANHSDWSGPRGSQGYVVKKCRVCGDYWGVRRQYDPGTGSDDRYHRFGSDLATVKRHY